MVSFTDSVKLGEYLKEVDYDGGSDVENINFPEGSSIITKKMYVK